MEEGCGDLASTGYTLALCSFTVVAKDGRSGALNLPYLL